MDSNTSTDIKVVKSKSVSPSRVKMARELRKQADTLRTKGNTPAELWLAEQYEETAKLLN